MSWFKKKDTNDAPPLPPTIPTNIGGGGAGATPPRSVHADVFVENFRAFTSQLNMVSDACWEKCITKKAQSDLTIGELSCNDRCVMKYIQTSTKVGETFQQLMTQAATAGQQGPTQPGQPNK